MALFSIRYRLPSKIFLFAELAKNKSVAKNFKMFNKINIEINLYSGFIAIKHFKTI